MSAGLLESPLSADGPTPAAPSSPGGWPDYRAVWRWHFYAGLFSMPFVVILSISGALYLFKTEIEAWNDRPYDGLTVAGTPASAEAQVRAAVAAFPGSVPTGYEVPQESGSSARVMLRSEGETLRVYVHPETCAVLHSVRENDRLMRQLFRLHGELWMGDRGSNLVELAASWTIVMIVTGLYLWWPRNGRGLGGVLYPRLRKGSSIFWRDLHSVVGIWVSGLALFLLVSGLPWAKFWGTYFKTARQWTGTAVAQQDWTVGSDRSAAPSRGDSGGGGEHAGHGGGGGGRGRRGGGAMPKDLGGFDRVLAAVLPLGLPHPVVIAPPALATGTDWTAKAMTPNRPLRVNLVVNGTTGEIVSREDFGDRHLVDRVVGYGIAAHEGRLFGWPNQLLGLMTAAGLVLLSVSGWILWWRRRDAGVLGAPRVLRGPQFSLGLLLCIGLLAIFLPLFGGSLLLVFLLERGLLCRLPRVRHWLGLRPPAGVAEVLPV